MAPVAFGASERRSGAACARSWVYGYAINALANRGRLLHNRHRTPAAPEIQGHMRTLAERTGEGAARAIRSFLPSLGGAKMRQTISGMQVCFHVTGTHSSPA